MDIPERTPRRGNTIEQRKAEIQLRVVASGRAVNSISDQLSVDTRLGEEEAVSLLFLFAFYSLKELESQEEGFAADLAFPKDDIAASTAREDLHRIVPELVDLQEVVSAAQSGDYAYLKEWSIAEANRPREDEEMGTLYQSLAQLSGSIPDRGSLLAPPVVPWEDPRFSGQGASQE